MPTALPPTARLWLGRVPTRLRRPAELGVRTALDTIADRVPGLAAEIAFYAILSLPPLLLTAVAGLGFLDPLVTERTVGAVVDASRQVFTTETVREVVEPTVQRVVRSPRSDILSFGFLLALYSASRVARVLITAVEIAYDTSALRPAWKTRLYGVGATFGILLLVPLLVPLLVFGPGFGAVLADLPAIPSIVETIWLLAYWPGVAALGVGALATVFHLLTPYATPWRRDVPGAVLAVALWLVGSTLLRTYTDRAFTGEGSIYAPIAGPLVVLVWLYVLGFAVLLGAELNSELEQMDPRGRARRKRETARREDAAAS